MTENVQVALRIRECPSQNGNGHTLQPNPQHPTLITLKHPLDPDKSLREFHFEKTLWQDASQEIVFHEFGKPLIEKAFSGYSTTLFAYGMTGSGKTHSIFGANGIPRGPQKGILPRSIQLIFDRIKNDKHAQYTVFVSFLEIYMDQIGDLGRCYIDWQQNGKKGEATQLEQFLKEERKKNDSGQLYPYKRLEIREDTEKQVYIENLENIPVSTAEDALEVCEVGVKYRATFETMLNEYSSRSHTIFTVEIFKKSLSANGEEEVTQGRINFVDLAGSERLKRSQSTNQRMKEAVNINSSLTALGNVILALYNISPHIPYRDSKLTRILQSSLGGNSYTTLLATLDPRVENYDETLATLQFAFRCKNVRNQPQINYVDMSLAAKDRRIKQLENEIVKLKRELISQRNAFLEGKGDFIEDEQGNTLQKNKRLRGRPGTANFLSNLNGFDNISNIPSDANSAEIERIRSEKKFAVVVKETQNLKEKMKEKSEAINKLTSNLEEEEKKYKTALHDIKKKQTEVIKDMKSQKINFQHQLQEQRAEFEKTIQEQKSYYEKQIATLNNIINSQPEISKAKPSSQSKRQGFEKETEDTFKIDYEQKLREMSQNHLASLDELRSHYDQIIASKEAEIFSLSTILENNNLNSRSEIQVLKDQLEYLYEYCTKLSMIVNKMEKGEYPVQMKANISYIAINSKDKPDPLLSDLLPHLKDRLVNVDEFIHEGEIYTTHPSINATTSSPFKRNSSRYSSAPKKPLDLVKLKRPPTGRTATSRYSTGNFSYPTTPQGNNNSRPASASASFRSFKNKMIEKIKDNLEDLNDPERYKDLFLKEQTRYKELKIAFEALKRENLRIKEQVPIRRASTITRQ